MCCIQSVKCFMHISITGAHLCCSISVHLLQAGSVIFVNENENENYQKRKNNDFVNEN